MIVRLLLRVVVEKTWRPRAMSPWGFLSVWRKRSEALMNRKSSSKKNNVVRLGFEHTPCQAADKVLEMLG